MSCANSDLFETPNFTPNPCYVGIGGAHFVSGTCTQVTFKGGVGTGIYNDYTVVSPDTYRWMCSEIGDGSGEWVPLPGMTDNDQYIYGLSGHQANLLECGSDSCNHYQVHNNVSGGNSSCCDDAAGNRCCTSYGLMLPCIRQSFKGNPLQCCFNDEDGVGLSGCWAGPAQKGTCHPCQRDITAGIDQVIEVPEYNSLGQELTTTVTTSCSSIDLQLNPFEGSTNCRDIAMSYCTGSDLAPDDPSWIYRWMDPEGNPLPYEKGNPSCYYALLRNLGEGGEILNTQESPCIPRTLGNIPPGGLAWSQRLMNIVFAKYTRLGFQLPSSIGSPGYNTFQRFLHDNVCCPYPIVCQQGLQATCRDQTMESISLNPQLLNWCGCYLPEEEYTKYVNTYGINKSCVPACNSASAVKLVAANNVYTECTQGVCIIDGVTINIINSSGGDIGLNQVCSCQDCTCVVSDTSITAINSEFGDVNINNKCGSFQCTDLNGGLIPCIAVTRNWIWLYVLIAVAIVILFIGICIYLVTRK